MESEAPPSAGWYHFLGWLDVNKKRVAIGAGIVVIVGFAIALIVWQRSERQTEAAEALSSVRTPFNPAEPLPPTLPEQYLKIASKYEKTPAGAQALLRAATAYFDLGQFPKAQETFSKFIQTYSDTPWIGQAQYGVAACLEAQGRTPEAITKYNDYLTSTHGNDPAADEARFAVARLYEKSNQPAQAIDTLTKMTNGVPPYSPVIGEVQERLRALYTKNPALVPARPAPTMIPPMLGTNGPRVITTNIMRAPNGTAPGAPKINLQVPTQPKQPAK